MTDYGVQTTGFVRKPLSVIMAEIEAENRLTFGDGVIQTTESPLGQLNGVFAEAASILWEMAEDTYQSYDPDQAEGARLDILGRIRLLTRGTGETDEDFRLAITNTGRARLDTADVERAVMSVSGVTYAKTWVNDTAFYDANVIPAHSVCLAVIGGDDLAVASALRTYIAPGVGTYGATSVDVSVDGFCRQISIQRITARALKIALTVSAPRDKAGCPPPSALAIKTALASAFAGDFALVNGQDLTIHHLRSALAQSHPSVEIVSGQACYLVGGTLAPLPLSIPFADIGTVSADDIEITVT